MTAGRIRNIAPILSLIFLVSACWIPLPEDTAIVVEVLDSQGKPVDGVQFNLDGTETLTTGTQSEAGQVYKNLSASGFHTLQLDTVSLLDPQGGIGWAPLASQVSGDPFPSSFYARPFAGGTNVLNVPVNKGEITVVTIYLDDILKSPADNQWLTDGSDPSSAYRPQNDNDEFQDNPEPVFWWRQDPSLGKTVTHTFQLWEDDDGDTRFPLGIVDHAQYTEYLRVTSPEYRQPDWQVPLAGIQRAKSTGINEVTLWSSQAADLDSNPVKYDLYYAPTTLWINADWERNPVLRDVASTSDGAAEKFTVGSGTSNSGLILKNGTGYTFALRARDSVSNLDTTAPTSTHKATPGESATSLGGVTSLSAFADSSIGGQIQLTFGCQASPADPLRIYAAPSQDFLDHPYDVRFIRESITCVSSPDTYALSGLVNGVTYTVGIEPFDAEGNVGTASSFVLATPSSTAAVDTAPPSLPTIAVSSPGPGQVTINVSAVSDSTSSVFRRIYWAPVSLTANHEAMLFTDLAATTPLSVTFSDIPNGIGYNYAVRAIDAAGNTSLAATQYTLSNSDNVGPTWASDEPDFFTTISYSATGSVWPLGLTWKYSGFALGLDPEQGQGEYVWRIIQENPDTDTSRTTKLGAFYTWSGYYYASTESGGLSMPAPSTNVNHRDIFNFVESGIASADVMGDPFDSSDPSGYRQRTTASFSNSLATGSITTNQLTIFYNTDEDGQALVFPATLDGKPGYAGNLRVLVVNKQPPPPTPEPHLEGKEFRMSYFTGTDDLETDPEPLFGGSVYFSGTLDDPDFLDPLW